MENYREIFKDVFKPYIKQTHCFDLLYQLLRSSRLDGENIHYNSNSIQADVRFEGLDYRVEITPINKCGHKNYVMLAGDEEIHCEDCGVKL